MRHLRTVVVPSAEPLSPDQLKSLEKFGFVRKRATLHGFGDGTDKVIYEVTAAGMALLNNRIKAE